MTETMTGSEVLTVEFMAPLSGQIPKGWCAWDMPCGCRDAASEEGETAKVRCTPDCNCAICLAPPSGGNDG